MTATIRAETPTEAYACSARHALIAIIEALDDRSVARFYLELCARFFEADRGIIIELDQTLLQAAHVETAIAKRRRVWGLLTHDGAVGRIREAMFWVFNLGLPAQDAIERVRLGQ